MRGTPALELLEYRYDAGMFETFVEANTFWATKANRKIETHGDGVVWSAGIVASKWTGHELNQGSTADLEQVPRAVFP
jgi:hypothetical protein